MGAVFLSPFYILLNIYLAARTLLWFSTLHPFLGSLWFTVPFLALFAAVALTPLAGAFCRGTPKSTAKRISNYWLGTLMYLLIFFLLADLIRIVYGLLRFHSPFTGFPRGIYRVVGGAILLSALALALYGSRHAAQIRKTHYDVTIQRACPLPSLRIALAADLHLGYGVGLRQLRKIKKTIDAMQPDLIVFAGDIFDNEYDAIARPEAAAALLGSLHSTYGSYACWGNHDMEEKILAGFTFPAGREGVSPDPRMKQFLKKAGIKMLEDETVLVDGLFYLCGRLDASWKEKTGQDRLTAGRLLSGLREPLPVIVVDHQPSQLHELADAGADLVLSGHTHDGQLFPGNLANRIGWKNSCGLYRYKNMTSIVTSGAGFWGPAMRIGTDSEVAEIDVVFRKQTKSI